MMGTMIRAGGFSTKEIVAEACASLALLAAIMLVFGKTVGYSFVAWDDPGYVLANVDVWSLSANSLLKIFTSFHNGNFHPLTLAAYAVLYRLFGLDPHLFHSANIALHVANALLLYSLLRRMKASLPIALAACAFWALHPQRVEAVAWVSGLKDLLSTSFLLLCMHLWFLRGERASAKVIGLVPLLFALALLAKGTSAVFAAIAILFDWSERKDAFAADMPLKILMIMAAAGATVLNFLARADFQQVLGESGSDATLILMQAVYRLGVYFGIGTLNLADNLFTPYLPNSPARYLYTGAGLSVIALTAALLFVFRKDRKALLFTLSFALSFVPCLGLVVVGVTMDRFSYYPSVFLALLLGHALDGAARRCPGDAAGKIKTAALATAVALCAAVASAKAEAWENTPSLWRHAILLYADKPGQTEDLAWCYSNLGWYYKTSGEYGLSLEPLRQATLHSPGTAFYQVNYADALTLSDHFKEAADRLSAARALGSNPLEVADITAKLAAKSGEGEKVLRQTEAEGETEAANPLYNYYLGCLRQYLGEHLSAVQAYGETIRLAPNKPDAYLKRAQSLTHLGFKEKALSDIETASRLGGDPGKAQWLKVYVMYGIREAELHRLM